MGKKRVNTIMRLKPLFGKFQLDYIEHFIKHNPSAMAIRVMIALPVFADFEGRVFAKRKHIANRLNVYPNRISQALKELERIGAIKRIKNYIQIDPLFISFKKDPKVRFIDIKRLDQSILDKSGVNDLR